jgi:uncharacterized membrane protein YbhN (UPF0104 family)
MTNLFKLPKRTSQIIKSIVVLGVFLLSARYAYLNRKDLAIIFTVQWVDVAKLLGLALLYEIVSSARYINLYRALGAELGIGESLGLSKVANALNMILPAQIGGVARAVYLKRKYALPYSQTPVIFLGSLVMSLSVGASIVILFDVIHTLVGRSVPFILWIGGAASASIFALWVTIPECITSRLGRIGNLLSLFSDGLERLRANRQTLFRAIFYQILLFSIGGAQVAVAYKSMGLQVDLLTGMAIIAFKSFLSLINLTPGNLGIRESVFGYLSELSGLSFAQGVAASVLIRAVGLVITYSIAPIAWYLLFFRQNISIHLHENASR